MTNIERGEISLDVPFDDKRTDHFVLKFSNAGHRMMENFLDLESSEILWRINSGRIGARIVTGLFWGATRKFHARDFESTDAIDDYMDEIDDESEQPSEAAQAILVALVAAYTKSNPSDIEAALMGEETPVTSNGEVPKGRGTREILEEASDEPEEKPEKKLKAVPKKKAASGGNS